MNYFFYHKMKRYIFFIIRKAIESQIHDIRLCQTTNFAGKWLLFADGYCFINFP